MTDVNDKLLEYLVSHGVKYSHSSGETVLRLANSSLNELVSIILQGVAVSVYTQKKKELPSKKTPVRETESSSEEESTPKKIIKKAIKKIESSSEEEQTPKKSEKKTIKKIESSSEEETPKKSEKKVVSPSKSESSSEKKLLSVLQELRNNFTKGSVEDLRNKVRKKIKTKNGYPDVTEELVQELVDQYDKIFLKGYINYALKEKKLTLEVNVSKLLTKTAGSVGIKPGKIIFKISNPVLMGVIPASVKQGLIANTDELVIDRLDAVMQIIEHELVHVITILHSPTQELNVQGKYDIAEHHGTWFTNTANTLFGHTRVTHMLIPSGRATPTSLKHTKEDFKLSQRVYFMNKDGKKLYGKVIKINPKKALVMTDNSLQFRVPYIILHPA
jgi:hypothetical protein